ncbi:hypothetical protein Taro_008458 [Colocasia esculenta]|uniref:Uncharacterized protein n=1 Tax=Colocasia esculenta TaxID=4460 RepID=A0A843TXN6_COLES|nr:hypothetical protein [Colocasia esculenta]
MVEMAGVVDVGIAETGVVEEAVEQVVGSERADVEAWDYELCQGHLPVVGVAVVVGIVVGKAAGIVAAIAGIVVVVVVAAVTSAVVAAVFDPAGPSQNHFGVEGLDCTGAWFRSHVVVSGVRPQLGQAAVLHVLCVSVVALSRPCTRAEAGARLASRVRGLWVPLLAASGGGLVAVVVTTLSSRRFQVFLIAQACTAVIAWLCLVSVGVVVPVALAGEGLVIPTGPCSRGSPPYFLQLGARRCGSLVSDGLQRRLWHRVVVSSSESERCVQLPCMIRARVAGCSCCCAVCVASVVAQCVRAAAVRSALDSMAVVFLVWRTLSRSPFVASGGGSSRECFVFVSGHRCVAPVIRSVPFGWAAFCQGVVPLAVHLAVALASLSRRSFPSFLSRAGRLCVSPWLEWFASFLAPCVLSQLVV